MWAAIADYLKRLQDSSDRSATIHDAMYLMGCVCFAFWLNHGLYKGKGFTEGWNNCAITFAGLVGAAKIMGGFSDRPTKGGQ